MIIDKEEKFGIVVLVDALGIKNYSDREILSFLAAQKYLKSFILKSIIKRTRGLIDIPDPIFKFFGDTILLTNQFKKNTYSYHYVLKTEIILNYLLPFAMSAGSGFIYRGAMAIGKYYEDEGLAIGPAIFDAATWYEKPQLFGIMTTPMTTNYLKSKILENSNETNENTLIQGDLISYDVPLKGKEVISTYLLNWPACIEWQLGVLKKEGVFEGRSPLLWYYDQISKRSIPPGTEEKYKNTETFVKYSLSHRHVEVNEAGAARGNGPKEIIKEKSNV